MKNKILFLLSGVLFPSVLFFLFFFKGKIEYVNLCYQMISNTDSSYKKMEMLTKPMTGLPINSSSLNLNSMYPISDELANYYKDEFNRTVQKVNKIRISDDTLIKDPWVYIPIDNFLLYGSFLKLHKEVSGVRVYIGRISADSIDKTSKFYIDHTEYFKNKNGAVIPIFEATKIIIDSLGRKYLTRDSLILMTDCNCGRPPKCGNGVPDYECAKQAIGCPNCPKGYLGN